VPEAIIVYFEIINVFFIYELYVCFSDMFDSTFLDLLFLSFILIFDVAFFHTIYW